jgi:sporulation protein YlmC with PRC-barrel domain
MFIKRSDASFIGVVKDEDLNINEQETKKALEKAAKEIEKQKKLANSEAN